MKKDKLEEEIEKIEQTLKLLIVRLHTKDVLNKEDVEDIIRLLK